MAVRIPIGADTREFEKSVKQVVDKTEKWLKGHSSTRNVPLATAANQAKDMLKTMDQLQKKQEKLAQTKIPTEQYTQRINKLKEEQKLYEQLTRQRDKLMSQRGPTAQYSSTQQQYQDAVKQYEKLDKEYRKSGGVYEQAQAWIDYQEQVTNTSAALEEAQQHLQELQDQQAKGVDTTKRDNLKQVLDLSNARIKALTDQGNVDKEITKKAYEENATILREYLAEESKVNAAQQELDNNIQLAQATVDNYASQLEDLNGVLDENYDNFMQVANALFEQEEVGNVVEELAVDLERMRAAGEDNAFLHPEELAETNAQLEQTVQNIDQLETDMEHMRATGEDTILGSETEEFRQGEEQISRLSNKISILYARMRQLSFKSISQPLLKIFNSLNGVVNRLYDVIVKFGPKLLGVFTGLFGRVRQTNKLLGISLKNLIALGLGALGLKQIFSKLSSAIKEGFNNMVGANIHNLKNEMKDLKSELLQMTNAFGAAFEPAIQAILPYIQQLVAWITTLADKFAQLMAAMFGQTKYVKALKKNIDDASGSAKKALAPFDELNVLTKPSGTDYSGMFTEADVSAPMADLAEKIKALAKTLFAPIKGAWDKVGKYVIDSWKRVGTSLMALFRDIWDDFVTVWTQPATQKIFENLLTAFGNIGQMVAFIVDNFRKAWNLDDTGLKILEHLRNLLGLIADWIKDITYSWAEWASELNFTPLLSAIEQFLADFEPTLDSILGIFKDFNEQVLQPLAKWTIEKGLPELVGVFDRLLNDVDWDAVRAELSDLWDHLEPFAERVGEGLILFIEDVGTKIKDFVGSEEFQNFLDKFKEWMDGVSPEDVANTAKNILKVASAILVLKGAFAAIQGLTSIIKLIQAFCTLPFPITAVIGVTLAWVGGQEVGKMLGQLLFPEDAEYYQDFHWFGEGGYFDMDASEFYDAGKLMMSDIGQGIMDGYAEWTDSMYQLLLDQAPWSDAALFGTIYVEWDNLCNWFSDTGVGQFIGIFQEDTWKQDVEGAFTEMGNDIQTWWDTEIVTPFRDTKLGQLVSIFTDPNWKQDVEGAFTLLGEDIKLWWDNEIVTPFRDTKLGQLIAIFTDPNWKEDVVGAFRLMGDDIKAWWDALSAPENWTFEGIKTAFNDAIYAIKMMWNDLATWLNDKLKIDIAGKEVSLGTLPTFSTGGKGTSPGGKHGMASGGVIPPYASEHMVMVGDNDVETEVVSPLSTMQEAMVNALQQVGLGNGDGQPINIYLGTDLIYSEIRKLEKRNTLMGG